jgi:hypothetical protein
VSISRTNKIHTEANTAQRVETQRLRPGHIHVQQRSRAEPSATLLTKNVLVPCSSTRSSQRNEPSPAITCNQSYQSWAGRGRAALTVMLSVPHTKAPAARIQPPPGVTPKGNICTDKVMTSGRVSGLRLREDRTKSHTAWPCVEVLAARLASAATPASSAAGTTIGLHWHRAYTLQFVSTRLERRSALSFIQIMASPSAITVA